MPPLPSLSARIVALLAATCCALFAPLPATAQMAPQDLPPVDTVFLPSARAEARDRIVVTWKIADGFYLYRHRTKVQPVDAASFRDARLSMPAGRKHRDEFFGDVETYRGQLQATLAGQPNPARDAIALRIQYQGCADAGVCYPPQTRTLTVALPAAAGATAQDAGGGDALSRALAGGAAPALAASDAMPLPPEQAFGFEAIVGDGNTLLLRYTPAKGYYVYRDRGTLKIQNAPGIAAGAPRWPAGTRHHDEHFGDVVVYFDQVDVPLPLARTSTAAAPKASVVATFQGCQTGGICYPPMTRRIALSIPQGTLATAPATLPAGPAPATAATLPAPASPLPASAATPMASARDTAAPAAAPEPASTPLADNASRSPPPQGATRGVWASLLLALLGGLLLNLMPCVLPVLSLKALSLAQSSESRARTRQHAHWYTAGVLAAFAALGALALALRQAGLALGWGFQLQQPLVVAVLALVMFALGLGLSGLWHAGVRVGARGAAWMDRAGPSGDVATGVLAVVLATPCIGPFMGAALAYAFAGPALGGMAVFLALGLGLALPFLLIAYVPALARRLPRPGAWMQAFKQLMAFPMYLTAAWLLWVLARQRGADAVLWWSLAAIALALAAWAWSHARVTGARWAGIVAALALVALVLPLRAIHVLPRLQPAVAVGDAAADATAPQPWSPARLAELRAAGKVVFVNMTADWCVTCKANERAVFARDAFRATLRRADAAYLVGDYTDVDPAITAYLTQHRAVGVPLYVVYPRGGGEGRVLPTVVTQALVGEALAAAAQ